MHSSNDQEKISDLTWKYCIKIFITFQPSTFNWRNNMTVWTYTRPTRINLSTFDLRTVQPVDAVGLMSVNYNLLQVMLAIQRKGDDI